MAADGGGRASRRPRRSATAAPGCGSAPTQAWPEFISPENTSIGSVESRSASSRMMAADLPPSSSEHGLSFSAAILAISLPTALDPVNVNLSISGLAVSARPVSDAAGHDREHALGQAGLGEDLGHREQRQRGLGGGLDDDRAAREQRGAELVGGQEERHVPRGHRGDDADRLAQHHRLAVDAVAEVAPGELVGRAREELERRHRGAVLHHVDDRRRLTGLGGQQELQLVGALLHDLHGGGRAPRRAPAGDICGHGPSSKALRAAAHAASTSAARPAAPCRPVRRWRASAPR